MIKHIVAMNDSRAIGANNKLPWHLPEDLQLFREETLGRTIYMGTNTFKSILAYSKNGSILPGRHIRVISSSPAKVQTLIDEYGIYPNVDYWTKPMLDILIKSHPSLEVLIVGGAQLYAAYPPDEVLATRVHIDVEGADTFYPHDIFNLYYTNAAERRVSKVGLEYTVGYYSKTE